MSGNTQWEYRLEILGTAWRSPKPESIQSFLNELGEQGWEIFSLHRPHSSNKVWIAAKRPLSADASRQRRRQREWTFN
jgi:hypothetical protein